MKVNREEMLRCLAGVAPGLSMREVIEQSTCFCFRSGHIVTFNDEFACTIRSPLADVEGAVPAKPLMELLGKLAEPELDISSKGGELIVVGKGRRSGIRMEAQVMLPIDGIELPADDAWLKLDGDFCEAVDIVSQCVAQDNDVFQYTCIHINPEYVEGCDNFQLARYPVATPISRDSLIRGKGAKHIVGLGMQDVAETESWLHFRNPSGLVLSCRRYSDMYPDLNTFLEWDGSRTTLPGGLADASAKAEIFSGENVEGNHVIVELKRGGKLSIRGQGQSGWYEERHQVKYDGDDLKFMIAPKLLAALTAKAQECDVSASRLRINTGKAVYVACLFVAAPSVAAA